MNNVNGSIDGSEISSYLRVGDQDPSGNTVEAIYWTTKKYQIYLANSIVRYVLPDDYDVACKLRERLYVISTSRARLENLRVHSAVRERDKEFVTRMVARCMAQAFDGHGDKALPVLETLEKRMAAAIEGHYRMRFVTANGGSLIAILFLLVMILIYLPKANGWVPFDMNVIELYSRLAIVGALGAFLSVSLGIRELHFDVEMRTREHVYSGGSRIIIGVVGALVFGLVLDSGFVSPTFGGEVGRPVYYLFGFVAGFSETLVPNTLKRVEQSTSESKDQ